MVVVVVVDMLHMFVRYLVNYGAGCLLIQFLFRL